MPQRYIDTTLFDLFKVGPGPSSSHTIGPMKAGHHFAETCAALPRDLLVRAVRFRVRLYGSLSATGTGHGTDAAVVAGLLGTAPESCPAGLLQELMDDPHTRRKRSLGDGQVSVCVDDVSHDAIIHDFSYSNTLVADLLDAEDNVLHSQEYYSVGGGFIQWKGWEPPSLGKPVHRYSNMTELRAIVKEKGLNIYEIILDNEMAITGASRMQSSPDQFLTRINAYAFATAEENASGGVIVTAPTCGSAGVMPALVYALRHEMFIGDRAIREAFLASAAVGFIAKHNASIAGAEVGCQGEIGVASAMAAAFVADARGYRSRVTENAAEVALEHHLGITCDPVQGYVQIPCIERNAMGAIKAYNAAVITSGTDPYSQRVSLDAAIAAMAETGREMSCKFKETSLGGLAVSMVAC